MTKYRIRLANGRVIGPFIKNQLFDLKAKGHITGKEEAQVFPTGNWGPIHSFDFYPELMDEDKTIVNTPEVKEETFVIDLAALRAQKNEKEIDELVTEEPEPEPIELTETVRLSSTEVKETIGATHQTATEILPEEEPGERTIINPAAQKEIEAMRAKHAEELASQIMEEEPRLEVEEPEVKEESKQELVEINQADESTQMIQIDHVRSHLMEIAEKEEFKIETEAKEIKKKNPKAYDEEDEEEDDEAKKKKRKKLIMLAAGVVLLFAVLFPSEEKPKAQFKFLPPQIVFPIPYDKADVKRSDVELNQGKELFVKGNYPNIVAAGLKFKNSYENNLENNEALSLAVRAYGEQLPYSMNHLEDAQTLFKIIQSKKPYLSEDPNGVIGMALFYTSINKYGAAADIIAKYLKLHPKNVTPDLFAINLRILMKLGKIDVAKQFYEALMKAPQKTRYVYEALIDYMILNQDKDLAIEYVNDAIKNNPKIASLYLKRADLLMKEKKFKEVLQDLKQADAFALDYNNVNRAKFLELEGLLLAYSGKVQEATAQLNKSLALQDSTDLRIKLADLKSTDSQDDTSKLISESQAIKELLEARNFFDKKNYNLALSSAFKATDLFPGHIPSELFLSRVQLKLGLTAQALKTLEDLSKRYPNDKSINLALIDAYIDTYKFNAAKNRIAIASTTDLRNTPEFASANGRLYLQMGDSLQAISWFKQAMQLNPLNDQNIYLLADVLIRHANFDAATELLNRAMELDPVNPDYRISYAKILYERQDDQAAIGYLLSLMDEFGENSKVLSEIAIFYYRAGKIKGFQDYKTKIEQLPYKDKTLYEFLIRAALLDERYDEIPLYVEKLLEIEPGDLESMMTAGKVMFETGKLVEAAKWFKRIQDKLDTYPNVRYYSAKIKYLSNDLEGALAEVKKDIEENGENDADLVLMAQIYVDQGNMVDAENLYKKAQKLNARSYEAMIGLADISTKRNNFDLALDLYKRAMKEKSDEPIVHKKVGDVYRLLGQGTLAMESYKLYLEMNPEAPDKAQINSYINLMR